MKRTSVAVVTHPIEALREDHRRATRLIRMLSDRIGSLIQPSHEDLRIARNVMRYMVEFVDHQHHDREDRVISALRSRDASLKRRVHDSEQAHTELRMEGKDLLALLSELQGRRRAPIASAIDRLNRYLKALEEHFTSEEAELFVPALKTLTVADWKRIESSNAAAHDPLFGTEVEKEFQELYDIYVNQVRVIGTHSAHATSIAAAAVVDGSAAAVDGAKNAMAALRSGTQRAHHINRKGASAFVRSRNLSEAFSNFHSWCWNSFEEGLATARQVGDVVGGSARSALEPVSLALSAQPRNFENSHQAETSSPSWQVRLMNLGLRATIKRMAGSGTLEDIRTPRNGFERFIPSLAPDLSVQIVELGNATVEIISVAGADGDRTVLHCPGGGFVMAATQAHRLMAGRLARELNARVVMVHYRLAPENLFPAGLEDCCAAYEWLLAQGTPAASIVVSGDSAGGGLALSTVLRIRNQGMAMPGAVVLMSPVTDLTYSGGSRHSNRWVDPTMPNDVRNVIAQLYLGDVPQDDPHASPLFADLSNLPAVLILVGSTEVLLDDSLRVAAKIRAQGGDCDCEVWRDMPHDWILFGMLPESRRGLRRIVEFIDRVIDRVPALVG